jgi:lipid-A-disaccharide synthase-like uncharacterized protein
MTEGWFDTGHVWLAIGFLGQGLFFMRFFVQWLASEKEKKSVMPVAFWYFSIIGGSITLIYAIHQKELPFVFGQMTGLIIYTRNLYFIHGKHSRKAADETATPG